MRRAQTLEIIYVYLCVFLFIKRFVHIRVYIQLYSIVYVYRYHTSVRVSFTSFRTKLPQCTCICLHIHTYIHYILHTIWYIWESNKNRVHFFQHPFTCIGVSLEIYIYIYTDVWYLLYIHIYIYAYLYLHMYIYSFIYAYVYFFIKCFSLQRRATWVGVYRFTRRRQCLH